METTSKRLKKALEIRNLKQADIIERTGINKGALSSYISGKYEPKQANLHLLAKTLDVSEAWLMGMDVPMERTENIVDSEFPPDIRAAARGMMELSENDRKSAIDMINFLSKRGKEAKNH